MAQAEPWEWPEQQIHYVSKLLERKIEAIARAICAHLRTNFGLTVKGYLFQPSTLGEALRRQGHESEEQRRGYPQCHVGYFGGGSAR